MADGGEGPGTYDATGDKQLKPFGLAGPIFAK